MRMFLFLALCSAVQLIARAGSSEGSRAEDWPHWLGPERNGVSPAKGLSEAFPEDGPAVAWRRPLGAGFSAIVTAGNLLYTQYGDGGREHVACFEVESGETLWRVETGALFVDHQGGDGPRSTPAILNGLLFVMTTHGELLALDRRSGRQQWSRNMITDFDGNMPTWGYSGSPVIQDNRLLVESGSSAMPSLLALHPEDGRLLWKTRPGKTGYSTPTVARIQGTAQAIFFTADSLVGVRLDNGARLWEWPWETPWGVNIATPVFAAPDRFFISSHYGKGGLLLRVRKTKNGWFPEKMWHSFEMNSEFGTSLLYEGYLYGFDNGALKCLDVETGRLQWKKRGMGKGNAIVADGKLWILSERGRLYLARARPEEFELLGDARVLQGRCWTPPTLARGRLFIRNESEMLCLNLIPASPESLEKVE